MKIKQFMLITAATAGSLIFTGCSHNMDSASDSTPRATSQIAFSAVTTPQDMVKWGSTQPNIRAIQSVTMVVPAEPSSDADVQESTVASAESLEPGAYFREAAGGDSQTYRVVKHTINGR